MKLSVILFFTALLITNAQVGTNGQGFETQGRPIKKFKLDINSETVTLGGVTSQNAMTINGSIPGPVIELNEGDLALIKVTNHMSVETSMHWHGLIVPNYQDGVPYLTTPPIEPGETFEYVIPINQTGTYWYHSHTLLQEQRGVFGSIVIHPKNEMLQYDKELVVMFSDWTKENPMHVLKNLKRGNEWYQLKKKTAVPLGRTIKEHAFGAQMKMWRDRMDGADIADVYYPAFLCNGQSAATYPEFKPGEKVRLRLINGASSSNFWMNFSGGNPMIVAADGIEVQPVMKDRFLFAIAETYDVIVTVPAGGLQLSATCQDGSGYALLNLGNENPPNAAIINRPDKVDMMKIYAGMDMKMGAPAIIGNRKKWTPEYLQNRYGMKMNMDGGMDHDMHMDHSQHQMNDGMEMDHDGHDMKSKNESMQMDHSQHQMDDSMQMDHNGHKMGEMDENMEMNHTQHQMPDGTMMNNEDMHAGHDMNNMASSSDVPPSEFGYWERQKYFNYNFLKAKESTEFNKNIKVNEMLFDLTGNMNRYVWSLNGLPMTEDSTILIKKGEITRITLNNLTMMHHPMHLHGHFFRVINENGDRSPLKHTVNVPPMQKVTIEFYNEESGDWIFHCHVLYHMMSGMSRVFSYGTPRDERLKPYPLKNLMNEMDRYYTWGLGNLGSNFSEVSYTISDIRNEFWVDAEFDYDQNIEVEFNYNRYLNDWVRLYAGVNSENEVDYDWDKMNTVFLGGVKYFAPYMFNFDLSLDSQLRPRIQIDQEFLLFPNTFFEGEFTYRADFGWVNDFENGKKYENELEWLLRLSYMFSRNFSLQANYHNFYGFGGGLNVMF